MELAVDPGAAQFALELFQHDHAGTLGHDEPGPGEVERPRLLGSCRGPIHQRPASRRSRPG